MIFGVGVVGGGRDGHQDGGRHLQDSYQNIAKFVPTFSGFLSAKNCSPNSLILFCNKI